MFKLSRIFLLVALVSFLTSPPAYSDGETLTPPEPLTATECGQLFAFECDLLCLEAGADSADGFIAAKPYADLQCVCKAPEREPEPGFGPGKVIEF